MKKIIFILTTTLALSIVVFGFSRSKADKPLGNIVPKRAIRFNIDQALYKGEILSAQIRVVNTVTETTEHDEHIQLTRKNRKYVSEPILLKEGNYRVEAITYMPDGKKSTFINMHELVLTPVPAYVY